MPNKILPSGIETKYYDRLFKAIFGRNNQQSKQWRLELYNALCGTNYKDPDALEINTIENVIYLTMKNDISFLVDSQMTLFEQQSSYNPNMPLRGLMYFAQLYQMHLTKIGRSLHYSKLVKIPYPKFVVFYNGNKETDDRIFLKLSDAFENKEKEGDFEWTAEMININQNHNITLQKNCKPLYDYVRYVSKLKNNKKNGLPADKAVSEAIDWAINQNLLNGFFKIQKEEVLAMSLTEFDVEEFKREMREEGREDQAIEDAVIAVREFNVSPQVAAEKMKAPLELVLQKLEESASC